MSERKNKQKKFKKRGQESSSSSSSSSESTSSLSSEDESNARDLKPMKEYLGDRKELARQLFIAVKGDKLRMMLPQVLKKMESKELEEWCANELSGMSKARILSILNGQPMLQSSDSNDSDDSGPSLEIISDTEEWGDASDLETMAREEEPQSKRALGSKKDKKGSKLRGERLSKEKDKGGRRLLKGKVKSEAVDPKAPKSSELVKVKKETENGEQSKEKEKDGESLLDLLELEMRARAIRALIRKEEDIIPTNPSNSASNPTQNPVSSKTRARDRQLSLKVVQDKLQELDSSFNRSVSKNTQEISEEEDVVLVLQPTTTIELLSSESDGEGGQGKRRNQKLENERVPSKKGTTTAPETEIGADKEKRKPEAEAVASETNKSSSADSGCSSNSTKNTTTEGENGAEKSPKKVTTDLEMFRMFKKKSQLKEPEDINLNKELNSSSKDAAQESEVIKKAEAGVPDEKKSTEGIESAEAEPKPTASPKKIASPKPVEKKPEIDERPEAEEDKSTDLEIIIDLDDYPDDMEDLDGGNKRTVESSSSSNSQEKRVEECKEDPVAKPTDDAETWATRYYQTEDVQSVIKESKIQSEIRKRLRERQRLARLNNSPSLSAAQSTVATPIAGSEKTAGEKEDSPTTGSVEEYLALKNAESVTPSAEDGEISEEPAELKDGKIAEPTVSETGAEISETIAKDDQNLTKVVVADEVG